jgi:hypothetical protein
MTLAISKVNKKCNIRWNMQYEKLVEFKRRNGDCRVLRGGNEQDKALARWVDKQRTYHTRNEMRQDRKDLLDILEFAWSVDSAVGNADGRVAVRPLNDKKWHQHYKRLVAFKRKNGDCIVPQRYEQDKSLGQWVNRQRKFQCDNKLQQDRKDLLDDLEFAWSVDGTVGRNADGHVAVRPSDDKKWHQHYEKLVEFQRKNGDCIVPQRYEQDKSLRRWVVRQRAHHNTNKLRKDRKELLKKLGFIWNLEDHEWYLQYEKVVAFKQQHQHCRSMYKEDASLCAWVQTQRKNHKKKKIRPDRKSLLEALDLVWDADTLVARRSSTTNDVSGLVLGSSHALGRVLFLTLLLFMLALCVGMGV